MYYDACRIWVLARRNRRKRPDLGPGPNYEGMSDSCWACETVRFLAMWTPTCETHKRQKAKRARLRPAGPSELLARHRRTCTKATT